MRSREEALAAVRERLELTTADQDPRWVRGMRPWRTRGNSRRLLTLPGDLDATEVLGKFCWFRFEAHGQEAGQDDLTSAACFFAPVSAADPGAVPGPLRPLYAGSGGHGETFDPGAAAAARVKCFLPTRTLESFPALGGDLVLPGCRPGHCGRGSGPGRVPVRAGRCPAPAGRAVRGVQHPGKNRGGAAGSGGRRPGRPSRPRRPS